MGSTSLKETVPKPTENSYRLSLKMDIALDHFDKLAHRRDARRRVKSWPETRILLEDSLQLQGGAVLFEGPREIIRADESEEIAGALRRMERAVASGCYVVGFFSYELGYVLEPRLRPLLPVDRRVPLLWFGVFDRARDLNRYDCMTLLTAEDNTSCELSDFRFSLDREAYYSRFQAVKDYIAQGDIYQLNLTLKSKFGWAGSPLALYRDLRTAQPVAYGALLETPEFDVISASPELFLTLRDGIATTRPMKGTATRGHTADEDAELKKWLRADLKSRAENLMIVDLMRNDLGRVSEIGSVEVTDLFTVETYPSLHQMTSGVRARLRAGTRLEELLVSLFPPGSIIGAPKVRAQEIIAELETEPRGIYTGAIGMIAPNGNMRFNVAIRTLTLWPDGSGEIGIGAGVVQDSEPQAEYDESLLKMKFLNTTTADFELIETLRWDAGAVSPLAGYVLLERHMDRLRTSAEHFGYTCPDQAVREALVEVAKTFDKSCYRIRLLLSHAGDFSITPTAMTEPQPNDVMRYVTSPTRINSANEFLYHKTTKRKLYDREHAEFSESYGCDEVIYLNERGELSEGSRTNIFLEFDIPDGDADIAPLSTPAIDSGLLPGTLRAELLENGTAVEAVLTLEDLHRAKTVYLGNSVRGLLRAESAHIPT